MEDRLTAPPSRSFASASGRERILLGLRRGGIWIGPRIGFPLRHVEQAVLAGAERAHRQTHADRLEGIRRQLEELAHELALLVEVGRGTGLVVELHALLLAFRGFLTLLSAGDVPLRPQEAVTGALGVLCEEVARVEHDV